MRYLLISFFTVFIFCSCEFFTGSITGNVFWKYNDYVGNKPDAGSSIFLYPIKNGAEPIKATADVQGNFSFEKLKTGDYLLIVVSENTTMSSETLLEEILSSMDDLEKIYNLKLNDSITQKIDAFEKYDYYSVGVLIKDYDRYSEVKDTVNTKSMEVLELLVEQKNFEWFSFSQKIEIQKIKIEKGKNTDVVVDFGITYY